jgi:hypothetical protein
MQPPHDTNSKNCWRYAPAGKGPDSYRATDGPGQWTSGKPARKIITDPKEEDKIRFGWLVGAEPFSLNNFLALFSLEVD